MRQSKRWHVNPATLPPIDLFGTTHSTLAWELNCDLKETRAIRKRFMESAESLVLAFKEDQDRTVPPSSLWESPIYFLENLNEDADCCGEGNLAKINIHHNDTPKSLFAKNTNNGLWLFSPYLCGTAQVEFFNYSYEWGARIWDFSGLMIGFFHFYNMLLQCGHIKRQIPFFEQAIDLFKDDIFKNGRPLLGANDGTGSDKKNAVSTKAFQLEIKMLLRPVNKTDLYSNRFKNSSKLYALGEVKFMKERIDTKLFPTLTEKAPRTAIPFLDAMRSDLESDFEVKASASTLNFSAVLESVSCIPFSNLGHLRIIVLTSDQDPSPPPRHRP